MKKSRERERETYPEEKRRKGFMDWKWREWEKEVSFEFGRKRWNKVRYRDRQEEITYAIY